MRKATKTAVSALLTASFVMSICSCDLIKDKAPDEVLDAAETYAKNVAACDLGKLKKLSDDDFDKKTEDWEALLDFREGDIYNDNAAAFASAVADTITYEIDEESVEASTKKGSGSVDVIFTMADYEDLLEDEEITDIDALTDAIADADTQEIKVTLEFEGEDGTWLVTNYTKVFDKVYVFTDTTEITYRTPLADLYSGTVWYDSDDGNGSYTNTFYIWCQISFSGDVSASDVYYTISYGGSEIYTDSYMYDECYFDIDSTGAPLDDSNSYLAAGDYTITFYDSYDDSVIAVETATVSLDIADPTPTAPSSSSSGDLMYLSDYSGHEGEIQYYDNAASDSADFVGIIDTDFTGWYDPETDYSNFGIYTSDSTQIQFSVSTITEYEGMTFKVFYLPDGLVDNSTDITGRIEPELNYYNGFPYYDCTIDISDYGSGYYVIGIYSAEATDQWPSIVSVCQVM